MGAVLLVSLGSLSTQRRAQTLLWPTRNLKNHNDIDNDDPDIDDVDVEVDDDDDHEMTKRTGGRIMVDQGGREGCSWCRILNTLP